MKWIPIALILMFVTLAACDLVGNGETTPVVATATPSNASATATDAPMGAPTGVVTDAPTQIGTPATPEVQPPVSRSITLTVWTNTEIAPNNDVPGGPVLLGQLSAFDNDRSNVSLVVELKTIADQGGILSYLRTGRSVAPGILPDVILLPSSQLNAAAGEGLIFPLDGLLAQEAVDDLFPAARDLVEFEEQIYAYPFALTNLQHLVYNSSAITETVSADWTDLVAQRPGTLIYPAAGSAGAELTAHFYRELGGAFVDEDGQPDLQTDPLVDALQLIRLAVAQGFVDPQSGSTASPDQAWQIFQDNPARIVQTTANYYLGRRAADASNDLRVVALPGPDGALAPAVGAWTWAISTSDPERQEVAAQLISWLVSAENVGQWCLQSYSVPARSSAFDVWPDDSYIDFLQQRASNAIAVPAGINNTVLTALSDATTGVILGLSTPVDAAEQARAAVSP